MTETATSAAPKDQNETSEARSAYGFGLATIASATGGDNAEATVLDVWFPAPALGIAADNLRAVENADETLVQLAESGTDADRGTEQKVVFVQINLDEAPADTADAYLRLHLLSHRLVRPNTINLDGIFGKLPNVVWTNFGPPRWKASN
ncbi:2,3,4,5-tetrahydropyridine-2,6-dicarboxylate N-succinyltransferase [Arthrobacter sp. Hiyo4]|nr:2,3,4,5-tetrahydropyridine-2,6-dicarboxylate N-succinyltransferase [Arthrobacter sp. Hiyo4]